MSSNPAGGVSREFCVKNAATSMEMGGRWPVAASPEKKFAIIFGFFRIFILPSVNLCQVFFRHSAKPLPSAVGTRHSAKRGCPVVIDITINESDFVFLFFVNFILFSILP